MDRQTLIPMVNAALAEEFELDMEQLVPEARLHEDLNLDSLDYVDMVIVLEKTLHCKITDKQQLSSIRTLNDVYAFIESIRESEQKPH